MNYLYTEMPKENKTILINFRIRKDVKSDLEVVAELRGSTISGLLHQFIVKTIREEKEREPNAFQSEKTKSEISPYKLNDINKSKSDTKTEKSIKKKAS